MAGLARIAKMYGGMVINGEKYVWDYLADKAVPESEMPFGSERHKESERTKYTQHQLALNEAWERDPDQ